MYKTSVTLLVNEKQLSKFAKQPFVIVTFLSHSAIYLSHTFPMGQPCVASWVEGNFVVTAGTERKNVIE